MEYRSEEYEEKIEKLAEMYPELSRAELEEAEYNLRAYLELFVKIWTRVYNEPGGKERIEKMLRETEKGESPE